MTSFAPGTAVPSLKSAFETVSWDSSSVTVRTPSLIAASFVLTIMAAEPPSTFLVSMVNSWMVGSNVYPAGALTSVIVKIYGSSFPSAAKRAVSVMFNAALPSASVVIVPTSMPPRVLFFTEKVAPASGLPSLFFFTTFTATGSGLSTTRIPVRASAVLKSVTWISCTGAVS